MPKQQRKGRLSIAERVRLAERLRVQVDDQSQLDGYIAEIKKEK